jgi:protein-disulfide isomerase
VTSNEVCDTQGHMSLGQEASVTRMWACCGLAVVLCSTGFLRAADGDCMAISADLATHVTEYLSWRIVSESGGSPSIVSISRVPGTCYQKLLIHVPGTSNPLALYLSPDQRFLTSTLYDLASDPKQEAERVAADAERLLMRDESPRLSGLDPRVSLVEFGDLQCPYCRRFADWYRALPSELRDKTALIFKHLPLAQHSWAQSAAQYSACASQQSTAAFWKLANYLLAHQDEITPANLKDKVTLALSQPPNVNLQALASCATTGMGPGLVERDTTVARELAVSRTPTIFINGRRETTPHSEEDLRLLLEHELQGRSTHVAAAGQ